MQCIFFLLCLLCLSLPAAQAQTATRTLDTAALEKALAARLDQARAAGFSGSVLLADGDHVLFEQSYGVADPLKQVPVTQDTRFNLASTGKLFTTVAVLQLVQRGKLDLDTPIGRYLPGWPVAAVREKVTTRQLLQHTSGLGSFWGAQFEQARTALHLLADYRPLLAQQPQFEPGTRWQYSNVGFLLLGLLVEAVGGQDYYDYVEKHIFTPAGMRDSGYFAVDGKASNVATPHKGGNGADHAQTYAMPEPRGAAAGGGYSTPRDLLRFHRALAAGKLLDRATLGLMLAPVDLPATERKPPPHGLGILRFDASGDVVYGHPGGAPGIGVDFRATRTSGWALILMSNSGEPALMPLAQSLADIVAEAGGADLRLPRRPR